ncbi:hypothetical protein [Streptomyces sp. NPDC047000]|uniref:hypothetical protein n=1 Tax=Streptomyces sp. NPDC047000 TaxID=3155474 RepID=UPI0033C1DCA7
MTGPAARGRAGHTPVRALGGPLDLVRGPDGIGRDGSARSAPGPSGRRHGAAHPVPATTGGAPAADRRRHSSSGRGGRP